MLRKIVWIAMILAVIIGISLFGTGQSTVLAQEQPHNDFMGIWCLGKIVFSSDRGGRFGIYLVSEKVMTPIVDSVDNDFHPKCSPDGKQIAGMRTNASKVSTIWLADVSGKNQRLVAKELTPSRSSQLAWSPKGELVGSFYDQKKIQNIFAVDIVSGKLRPLTTDEDMDKNDPVFAKDGSLCFSGRIVGEQSWKVYCDKKGKRMLRYDLITNSSMMSVCPKDGRWAFAEQVSPEVSIIAIETPSGGLQHLEVGSDFAIFPDWSPDCTKIVFSAVTPERVFRIYVYQLDNGQVTLIDRPTAGSLKSAPSQMATTPSDF